MLSETGQVQGSRDPLQRDPDARPRERVWICRWYDHCLIMALHYSLADRLHAFFLWKFFFSFFGTIKNWTVVIAEWYILMTSPTNPRLLISWPFCTPGLWFTTIHSEPWISPKSRSKPKITFLIPWNIGLIHTQNGLWLLHVLAICKYVLLWRWIDFQIWRLY